jgi:probable HAF family extracellular repeat protein
MRRFFISRHPIGVTIALRIALSLVIAQFALAGHALAQATAYTVVELSAPDEQQVATRLNNLGDLVGRGAAGGPGQSRATLWNHSTLLPTRLGAFSGGDYSSAFAINDLGEVTGASNTSASLVPFLWQSIGGLQRIALLPGDNCGQGLGINKAGHVVGYSSGPNGTRAFLWSRETGVRNLACLPGGSRSTAREINNSDQVVGTSGSPAGDRAVLWTSTGQIRNLGTLSGDISSEAAAINNAGNIVGYSKGHGRLRAFLWTEAAGIQDLGVLPGGESSRAVDINDSGQVIGSSTTPSGDRAFIWTNQEGMKDLNSAGSADLGVVFVEAHAINNLGQILVMGKSATEPDPSGGTTVPGHDDCAPAPPSTFLLTPTP